MRYLLVAILAVIAVYFITVTVWAVAFKVAGALIAIAFAAIAYWILKYKYKKARR